jgi:hypothetical protein
MRWKGQDMVQRMFNRYSTMRRELLEETTGFLGWALHHVGIFPRIPRIRVDSGIRFSERFKVAFWSSAILRMRQISREHEDSPDHRSPAPKE